MGEVIENGEVYYRLGLAGKIGAVAVIAGAAIGTFLEGSGTASDISLGIATGGATAVTYELTKAATYCIRSGREER